MFSIMSDTFLKKSMVSTVLGPVYISHRCVQALIFLFFSSATSADEVVGPLGRPKNQMAYLKEWIGVLENWNNKTLIERNYWHLDKN